MQEITQGHCRYITQSKADLHTNNYAKKKKKKKKNHNGLCINYKKQQVVHEHKCSIACWLALIVEVVIGFECE